MKDDLNLDEESQYLIKRISKKFHSIPELTINSLKISSFISSLTAKEKREEGNLDKEKIHDFEEELYELKKKKIEEEGFKEREIVFALFDILIKYERSTRPEAETETPEIR